jgi:hypothetical protein
MNSENSFPNNDNEQKELKDESNTEQQPLPVRNPFKPGDDKEITQEDIDNEQKFKEALSERD